MKIGILTFWETVDNYGQILQGYALQTYLKSLGHEVYIIRYDHNGIYRKAKNAKWCILVKLLKILMVYPVINHFLHIKEKKEKRIRTAYMERKNSQREFEYFRLRYFEYSKNLYRSLKDLQDNPPKADLYIVGSDQVWGWLLDKYDNQTFYLNFGSKAIKRIAYAPSFAMEEYPINQREILAEQLKRFDAISVRERSGVDICKSVGFNAKWVCDPTLLLRRDDYSSLLSTYQTEPYIYVYSINISRKEEIVWEDIVALSDTRNWSIKVTVSSGYFPAIELFEDVEYDYSKPEEWLSNIANAEIIVTTSFHGVVFCILFNKNFVFIPIKGKFSKGNNRVVELLEKLELSQHILNESNSLQSIVNNSTNWERTNYLVNLFRINSQDYLKSYLS